MARGRSGFYYLSYTAWTLLHYTPEVSASGSIWSVNIDNEPAPPPDQGPPFSANAIRNPAYLPYQILGIAGSYFIVVLFIGTLLLSFGQRARKRAQMAAESGKSTELKTYFSSPNPLGSPDRAVRGKKSATASVADLARSPASDSIVSFDPNVIAADRERRAQEMEKLYAAVMVQEDTRSHQKSWTASPPQYTHATPGQRQMQDQQQFNPRSPIKAIYPDEKSWPNGPVHSKSFSNASSSSAERAPSFTSAKSSYTNSSKKLRKSVRSLKISSPIIRGDDNTDGARTPLSPRMYTDPGVPPEPPTARTVDTAFEESYWHDEAYEQQTRYDRDEEKHDPTHDSVATSNRSKASQNFSQPRRMDAQQQFQSQQQSTTPVADTLPFRQLHWNTPSSPLYPYQGQGPFSAGPTKTTFVEVRRDRLGAPLTGAITPYSAYMPFTPLTPVTPHLTTRAERRQREREERTIHGAITEEDRVRDEDELWDESY